eukprot:gene10139-7097_t
MGGRAVDDVSGRHGGVTYQMKLEPAKESSAKKKLDMEASLGMHFRAERRSSSAAHFPSPLLLAGETKNKIENERDDADGNDLHSFPSAPPIVWLQRYLAFPTSCGCDTRGAGILCQTGNEADLGLGNRQSEERSMWGSGAQHTHSVRKKNGFSIIIWWWWTLPYLTPAPPNGMEMRRKFLVWGETDIPVSLLFHRTAGAVAAMENNNPSPATVTRRFPLHRLGERCGTLGWHGLDPPGSVSSVFIRSLLFTC